MAKLNQLVQRCRQGELAAFTELFQLYQVRVYRLAVTILRDERDAEDAMQDVFMRVFERIKGLQGRGILFDVADEDRGQLLSRQAAEAQAPPCPLAGLVTGAAKRGGSR